MIGKDTRITLKGPFNANKSVAVFEDIDILAVPSLWYENSPNVIFEAFVAPYTGNGNQFRRDGRNSSK